MTQDATGRHNADGRLIAELAAGATQQDAAKAAGVSERTVARRMADPDFRQRMTEARGEFLSRAIAQLAAASVQAVKTLVEVLDTEMPPAQRVSAARAILELGTDLRKASEFESRLAALEAKQHDPATTLRAVGGDRTTLDRPRGG